MCKEKTFEDILELEGVNSQGYGIVSQAFMFDIDLPIQSKAIYAYFCSFLGAGRTIFPKRETILSDLKIGRNAYYKHFKPLLENGYIEISKAKGYKNKNVYKVCNKPEKIKEIAESDKNESLLMTDGINAHGYGFVPKMIMCDKRLSIKAKGLIAFFYSLAQAGSCTYPHRKTICTFLRLSKEVYYNALNQLIAFGYITVKQRRNSHGKFNVNDYILNSNPEAVNKTPETTSEEDLPFQENEDIIKNSINTEDSPCPEKRDILKSSINTDVLPCPENEDIINCNRVREMNTLPCPGNEDNNNITNNNSNIYISSSNHKVISYATDLKAIPYTTDKEMIRDMIYNLTRYEDYLEEEPNCFNRLYKKTVQALIEMLCVEDHHIYAKQRVKTKDLFSALNDCIEKDFDGCSLRDLIGHIVWNYDRVRYMYKISKPYEYLKSIIWDHIKNYNL
ncbi:MAG: helix-turn-helix domain-containing protein [Ruminococcus sp.]|nr:helix-turn-helix domain-containing protein [Ruminococcus sp.]